MRGSVRARLSVRFSAVSAAQEGREIGREDIDAAGVHRAQAFFAATTWSDARRFAPASVRASEPLGKSNAARHCGPPSWRPAASSAAGQRSSDAAPATRRPPCRLRCVCRCAEARRRRGLQHPPARVARFAAGTGWRRRTRSQGLADHARLQRTEIGGDVRQFRQYSISVPVGMDAR